TSVSLSWLGHAYLGESSAAATPTSVHRSVATATLRALEEVVGNAARFELEQLEINQLGPDRAVVVVVAMLTKLGSERLTGVSVVREDVRQAVIRATLDSLNRRLESLLNPACPGPRHTLQRRQTDAVNAPHPKGEERRLAGRAVFVRQGTAQGDLPPAVLVHGLGGQSTNWTDFMAEMSTDLRTWAPDLPGFGWSPAPADSDYSVAA